MITVPYERNLGEGPQHLAMVQVLQASRRLLDAGRARHRRARGSFARSSAGRWSGRVALMIGLALVSWFFVSRRVLKRIDSVAVTSRRIMAGDLSRRLEVTGTGDEFDRLANSLNAMLERIEHLLLQLSDVSDNIAHDLKTPLTRLRNRVEAALAGPPSDEAYRAALVSDDRGIRPADPDLQRAPDDRPDRGRPARWRDDRGRGGRNRPRRGRALRAGGGGEGRRARRGDARADHAQGEPRAARPGARQPDRQRHQARACPRGRSARSGS